MKRLMAVAVVLLALPERALAPSRKVLLGITGDPVRFQAQAGQKSAIKHVFLGWQQGMTWGRSSVPPLEGRGHVDLAPKPQSKKLYRSCLTPLELMP